MAWLWLLHKSRIIAETWWMCKNRTPFDVRMMSERTCSIWLRVSFGLFIVWLKVPNGQWKIENRLACTFCVCVVWLRWLPSTIRYYFNWTAHAPMFIFKATFMTNNCPPSSTLAIRINKPNDLVRGQIIVNTMYVTVWRRLCCCCRFYSPDKNAYSLLLSP